MVMQSPPPFSTLGPSSAPSQLPGRIELINPVVTLGANILILLLALFMLYPLYKLSETRAVAVLLLSKTVGTILASSIITSLIFSNIVDLLSTGTQSVLASLMGTHSLLVRMHLMALAMNRMQSVFSPLSYSSKGNKKLIWAVAIVIWILCAYQAITHTFFPAISLNFFADKLYLNQFTVFGSTILYICISARLLHIRFISSSLGNQSEIDHIQICIVCLLGLLPFLFASLMPDWMRDTRYFAPNMAWLPKMMAILLNVDNDLCFFIEDICLLIICRDFRRMFFFSCRSKTNNNLNNNRIAAASNNNTNNNNDGRGTTLADDAIQSRMMRTAEATEQNENDPNVENIFSNIGTIRRLQHFSPFQSNRNIMRHPSQLIEIN